MSGVALSGLEVVRLFVSYQRYAFLLFAAAAVPLALVIWTAPGSWWAWVLAGGAALWIGSFAVSVWSRWPRKLRLTVVARTRIQRGSFLPTSVGSYCTDPCFRVVAHEVLRAAGLSRCDRRDLIHRLAQDADEGEQGLLVFDHELATVTRIDARGHTTLSPLSNIRTGTESS